MTDNLNYILNEKKKKNNTVKETFSSPVIVVKPESSIFDVLLQMQTNFVKHIVITDKDIPVGIVTERDINRYLEENKTAHALDEILIKHVMQKNIITLIDGEENYLVQCASRMETFKIGSVIIIDDNGKLKGIISKTDLTKTFANVFDGKYVVKKFMNKKVVTCRKPDSINFVLNILNKNQVSRLVVTDENGYPIGLISTNTLLTHSDYFTKGDPRSKEYLLPINKEKLTAYDLLVDNLVTVNEEEDLAIAASKMIKNKISGIPVTDSNRKLIGIISKTDVVRAFSIIGLHEDLRSRYKELY